MPNPRRQGTYSEEPAANSGKPELRRRTPQSNALPPSLQHAVPYCAWSCLTNYITQDYHCPTNDAACLCSHYSSQGFTLGELAYVCLEQECTSSTKAEATLAYHMCDSQPNAARETHSTLTFPPTTASRPGSVTTTRAGAHTTDAHSSKATTHHSTTSGASATDQSPSASSRRSTALTTMAPTQAQSGVLSSPTPISPPSSDGLRSTNLSSAQATGISIAAMGAIMLAIGAIYLCIYIRRRKVKCRDRKDFRSSYDFVDEAPPRFSPFKYGHADPRGPLGGFEKRRVELGNADKHVTDKHMTRWPVIRMSYDQYVASFGKSASITPPLEGRVSDESLWSVSQKDELEKPPPVAASRKLPRSPAPSGFTTMTLFEEDRPPVPTMPPALVIPPRKPLPTVPPAGIAVHYPPPPPSKNDPPQQSKQTVQSPGRERQPSLSLAIPKQAARVPSPATLEKFPLPPGAKLPPPPARPPPPTSAVPDSARNSAGSVLEYYASPQAGYETSPDIDLPTPVQLEARKRRGASNGITVSRAARPPRPPRLNSFGSDTSFESLASDEPTPPEEEEKQLTPVLESPLAGIRYPKVPRSSNQSVPRSPRAKLSPSSLPKLTTPSRTAARTQPQIKEDDRSLLPSNAKLDDETSSLYPPVTPDRKGTNTSTLSGSTLAAKRRGDNAAQDLERRFFVTDSSHSRGNSKASSNNSIGISNISKSDPNLLPRLQTQPQTQTQVLAKESPLKGYGRIASWNRGVRPAPPPHNGNTGLGLEMRNVGGPYQQFSYPQPQPQRQRYPGLPANPKQTVDGKNNVARDRGARSRESPLWEPKLTPSRRGEDLFLSVGVVTPLREGFGQA